MISYTEVKREVRNRFLYVFNIPLLGNFGMEVGGVCGERWGTRAGEKMTAGPCSVGGFESFL